jgi:hypothetical protein
MGRTRSEDVVFHVDHRPPDNVKRLGRILSSLRKKRITNNHTGTQTNEDFIIHAHNNDGISPHLYPLGLPVFRNIIQQLNLLRRENERLGAAIAGELTVD